MIITCLRAMIESRKPYEYARHTFHWSEGSQGSSVPSRTGRTFTRVGLMNFAHLEIYMILRDSSLHLRKCLNICQS